MPRKPSGRAPGRPGKPFRHYPGWIVKAIGGFISGDLTTKTFPEATLRNAQSAIATFNRARLKFIEEEAEKGNYEAIDIVTDIIARIETDALGHCVELSSRGHAVEALLVAREREAAHASQAIASAMAVAQEPSEDFESKLAREVAQGVPKAREIPPEQLAAIAQEEAELRERERAATEKLAANAQEQQIDRDMDEALKGDK